MGPKKNKRKEAGCFDNLIPFKQKEPARNNGRDIVEFAGKTNWADLEQMLMSDIDFTNRDNVLEQFGNMESKGYTVFRLSTNVMPLLKTGDI